MNYRGRMWEGGGGQDGVEWGGKWDNCNNIINKYIFFKKWRDSYKPLGQPEMFQYLNYRDARRRTAARNWKLIWTNNEGELPQSGEGNNFQEVQEAQRVPKKLDSKRNTPRHTIIKLPKIKYKERILKEARRKERVIYKGVPIRLSVDFSKQTLQARRGWKEVFHPSHERQGPTI